MPGNGREMILKVPVPLWRTVIAAGLMSTIFGMVVTMGHRMIVGNPGQVAGTRRNIISGIMAAIFAGPARRLI